MKERPILFSAPMVRAIIAGSKSQTRRIVKHNAPLRALSSNATFRAASPYPLAEDKSGRYQYFETDFGPIGLPSPYGEAGSHLWVRETHYCPGGKCPLDDWRVWYRADESNVPVTKWTPSIFMPRWASRITLEITGVRVERLQEITPDDAYEEGAAEWAAVNPPRASNGCLDKFNNIVQAYRALWDSINAKRAPWASNPWVWVIEFRRIAMNEYDDLDDRPRGDKPCPNCPDGYVWNADGPTGRCCPTCNGYAIVNLDGSPIADRMK